MDHFRFRSAVKVISFIDMTFSLVLFMLTLLTCLGVFMATVHDSGYHDLRLFFLQGHSKRIQDSPRKAFAELGRTFTIIWILSLTFNILQFFAGCALLSGTDLVDEEEDNKSVAKCRFWQWTSVCLFVFMMGLVWVHPTIYTLIFALAEFTFRAIGIYYVSLFVNELNEADSLNESLYIFDTPDPFIQDDAFAP